MIKFQYKSSSIYFQLLINTVHDKNVTPKTGFFKKKTRFLELKLFIRLENIYFFRPDSSFLKIFEEKDK